MSEFANLNIKRNVSISCLLIINFLFSFKYLTRITDFAWVLALGLTIFYVVLLAHKLKFNISAQAYKLFSITLIILFVIAASITFSKVNVENLNVDRWSVISSFWEAIFAGEYPYMARSHMENIPGPMPFYHVLALPFYLLGELGYFSLLGLFVLLYLFLRIKNLYNYKLLVLVFLLSSPFFLWEVVVRSNIFTTSILIVLFLYCFLQRKNNTGLGFYLYAVIAGLLLSTRAVFSIPYIIFFMYMLLKKDSTISQMIKFIVIAFIAFTLTFLPFMINWPNEFLEINPFIVQSTFLVPFYYTIGFIALAFVFSLLSKSQEDLFFWSGFAFF